MGDLEKQENGFEGKADVEQETGGSRRVVFNCSFADARDVEGRDDDVMEGMEFSEADVLRMWEGEVLDCFEHRRVAIETTWVLTALWIVYHFVCCTLCQESRTLEMNNVQDGTWHGRGDTICIGSYTEGSTALFGLIPPPLVSTKTPP